MAKKLTTEEILAAARAADSGGSAGAPETEPAAAPEAVESAEDSVTETPAAPAAPTSTADILAAARAQKSASEPKPATPAGGSPADILAAARAQGAGAAAKPAAPSSTSDVLAAARAQSGAAPAAKAPAKTDSAAKTAKSAAAAEKLSVEEMLKRLRSESVPGAAPAEKAEAVPEAPSAPKLPSKPLARVTAAPEKKEESSDRRTFIGWLVGSAMAIAFAVFAAINGIAGLALARFMFPNVIVAPPSKFKVGPAGDYPLNSVSTKWKPQFGVWIVHTNQYNGANLVYALASVCTHLGCTPSWLDAEQKYKCPCHGSGFYMNGINFEGPAPRPLERVGITLAADGMLEVDKSRKFQEELGQWNDPASFVELV